MASLGLKSLFAACALVAMPQMGAADLSALDLTELRKALRVVEADVSGDLTAPVDVSAIWASLPFAQDVPVPAAPAVESQTPIPAADNILGGDFLTSENVPNRVVTPANVTQTHPVPPNGGGLFAMQLSQTIVAEPALAPLAPPRFEPTNGFKPVLPRATAKPATGEVLPQDVTTTNFRLMLATLAQTYTGRNGMAVVNAQGPRGPIAISVRAGTVGLDDLHRYATALGMPPLADGTLTAPVVIWPGATLRLTGDDHLRLARDAGAFVLSMGALDINGAVIEAVGPENPHTPSFVPFVTVAAGGSLRLNGATVRGLGFGQTPKFSGLSVARNLLSQNVGEVVIRNTLFDGLQRVTIAGAGGAEVSGNTFINPTGNTLHLVNAPRAKITENLFVDGSHTNALRVEGGSIRAEITRNIFLAGQRVALMVSERSDHVQVRENIIWKRKGAGIKFLHTRCGLVEENVILDNLQKGVEVRKSDGTVLSSNLIAGNSNAAVWVSSQSEGAQTALNDNRLVANGAGLSAATGAQIFLHRNNFAKQLPKLLDGDIARLSRKIVVDLKGDGPLRLNKGAADDLAQRADLCGAQL